MTDLHSKIFDTPPPRSNCHVVFGKFRSNNKSCVGAPPSLWKILDPPLIWFTSLASPSTKGSPCSSPSWCIIFAVCLERNCGKVPFWGNSVTKQNGSKNFPLWKSFILRYSVTTSLLLCRSLSKVQNKVTSRFRIRIGRRPELGSLRFYNLSITLKITVRYLQYFRCRSLNTTACWEIFVDSFYRHILIWTLIMSIFIAVPWQKIIEVNSILDDCEASIFA